MNISNSVSVDSKDPAIASISDEMTENRLCISYTEGNEHWSNRGKFLPLYYVRTYGINLPLSGGGPQDKQTMALGSGELSLEVYPNPFRNNVHIRCRIHDTGYMIKIYDVSGRVVKSFNLESCIMNQASRIVWDGLDDSGRRLPAGVYFVRLETEGYDKIEKVILLR